MIGEVGKVLLIVGLQALVVFLVFLVVWVISAISKRFTVKDEELAVSIAFYAMIAAIVFSLAGGIMSSVGG